MITEAQQELINKYLHGRLDAKDQEELALLQSDSEFQNELEAQVNLQTAIRLNFRESLQRKIAELNEKKIETYHTSSEKFKLGDTPSKEGDQKKNIIGWRRMLPIAAGIALLIIAGTYFWKTINTDGVKIEHIALAGPAKGENAEDIEALQAYDQKEYRQAKQLFSEIPEDEKSDKVLFYNAITLLLLNQQEANLVDVDQAIQYLERLRNVNGNYKEMAEWYLALALLEKGEEDRAKAILEEIVQAPHPHSEEARQQLKRLSKDAN